MTDSDFEDNADFDVDDISSILKDIDNANLALDVMEGWWTRTCVCQPGAPAKRICSITSPSQLYRSCQQVEGEYHVSAPGTIPTKPIRQL
jgi:hypothetical protein